MMKKRGLYMLVIIVVILVLLSAGCGGKGGQTVSGQFTPLATDTLDSGAPLPPHVIGQTPSGGEEMPLDGYIEVYFDQPMDQAKTEAAWQLLDSKGNPVSGKISWPQDRTLRFQADKPLETATRYTAILTKGATSAEGVAIEEPFTFQVNTIGQLLVSQVFPPDGAMEVANDAVITVMFNRPVVPLVVAERQRDLPNPLTIQPQISGEGEWLNTSVYLFRPHKPLQGAINYKVTVKAGLADPLGAKLEQDYSWSFTTTAPSIAELQLVDRVVNPPDDYTGVPLDQKFAILFRQPMQRESVERSFSLVSEKGEKVVYRTSWNKDNTLMTIQPVTLLALGTTYHLKLESTAQAEGGGGLKEGLDWSFTTYFPPAIQSTEPQNGSRQVLYSGYASIRFVSPMKLESLRDKIEIIPRLEGALNWYYDEYNYSLEIYGFKPATYYTVRLKAGMEDLYGNQITTPFSFSFTTGSYSPSAYLEMPYWPALFRVPHLDSETEIQPTVKAPEMVFYVRHVNVSRLNFELYHLTPEEFMQMVQWGVGAGDFKPAEDNLVHRWTATPQGSKNEYKLTPVPLQTQSGEPLPRGFYYLVMTSPDLDQNGRYADERLFMVADANLTLKTSSDEALVWATDLTSGAPLENIALTIYDENLQPIGSGVTDADGLLHLENLISSVSSEENYYYYTRYASIDEGESYVGIASSNWGSGVSTYELGIWTDYYVPPQRSVAYIYTDRPLYRPGQPVYFKGIVRMNDDLAYRLPEQKAVVVTVSSYDEVVYEETLPLNDFGSFSGQLTLDKDAALGAYSIKAQFPGTEQEIGLIYFSVAEYRKPEFQVKVESDVTDVLVGTTFTVDVTAEYFSGGGVADAEVSWILNASPYTFTPSDEYLNYSFNDYDYDAGYYQPELPYGETIAEGKGYTDETGHLHLPLPADLGKSESSRRFTIEATVTDIATTSVSGRTDVIAHQSKLYPGIKPGQYVGIAGQEQTFDLILVDWDSNPLAEKALDVEIVERRWHSVQEQDPSGRIEWKSTVEEIPIAQFTDVKTDQDGKAMVKFVPPNGGVYKAIVKVLDDQGNQGRASAYMWVSGEGYIPWRQSNDRSFQLVPDRSIYQPGDTAELLIASPFEGEHYALVTIERGSIRQAQVTLLKNNSTVYRLPITADMAPNVYITIMLVKGAIPLSAREGDQTSAGMPDFRFGLAKITVDTSKQTLKVAVTPDRETAGPGETVTYNIKTTDLDGKPLSAEVSLALTDLATLTLMAPNTPPILDYFYSEESLSIQTSVPIVLSIEHYNANLQEAIAEGRGGGSGGGGKGIDAFGVLEIRQDFPDTAYWKADVVTDEQGEASVSVTLPDNLTIWRMDARAVTLETRVGQAEVDLRSTKPLLVRPQTPRFFVAGDEARLGMAVHNNTDQDLTVQAGLKASGVTVTTPLTQTVKIPAGQQTYVSWNVKVDEEAQIADLVFVAKGGEYEDASRPTLGQTGLEGIPIYRYEVPETVGTSGVIAADESLTKTEAISLPVDLGEIQKGELMVEIAPSLAAGMTDGLEFLKHYPYECIEQTISRFLPNVLTTSALKAAGIQDAQLESDLKEQVNLGLQRIYNLQNSDGGWGWWSKEKSDLQTSAYVVLGLQEARNAGYLVSEDVLKRGVGFLVQGLGSVKKTEQPYLLNRQAFAVYVLAKTGRPQVSRMVQLYDLRQSLSIYARAYLALAMHINDPKDPRLATLASDFVNAAILSASGAHWQEEWRDYWNWNTDTRTTAVVLAALVEIDPQNPLTANAVRWLMSNRSGGYWRTTQETAWTLMALTRWMEVSGELRADFEYAVVFNGERISGEGWQAANAETLRKTFDLTVDVARILSDQINRLTISRTEGAGNLYYTAHLKVSLPVEEVKALDQGIIISRSYSRPTDRLTSVSEATQGDVLLARLTIVVPNDLHYVIVEDPLPAGLEAIDQSLQTSIQEGAPLPYEDIDEMFTKGWGWWYFDHVELRDEKVVLSASYLPAGTYVYTYLVRAGIPGVFHLIPPTAQEFYFPEVYGRGDGGLFTVISK